MINYQILINDVDYTSDCALPFKEQYVLDSALDNGVLTIPMIRKNTIFKPFSLVTIKKDLDIYNMYIASDKMTKIVGTELYTHELILIEETKCLEKKVVDTNTTTQPLLHNYVKEAGFAYVKETVQSANTEEISYNYSDLIKSVGYPDSQFPSIQEFLNIRDNDLDYYTLSLVIVNKSDDSIISGTGGYTTPFIPDNPLAVSEYQITYNSMLIIDPSIGLFTIRTKTFTFAVVSKNQEVKKSITDVVNRLLAITDTLRASETPALVFNQEQADFYGQRDENNNPLYPAPEFSMTKSTLRECLDQVGSYIHSIVRLTGNTIYFDKLGGTEITTLDEDYIGNYETLDSEQYTTQLDSIVSNLTNIDDAITGTITEPFAFGYKTVRAESGTLRIGDGQNGSSAIIETDYPIERVEKLICGWVTTTNGDDVYVGDITPYVYEKSEYELLSSYDGTFPNSKGFAITYTQGQKNITGLTFKLPNAVSSIFENQAILNIISQKIGQNVQNLFNIQDITQLQFQLVYYPSTTARVKQSRTDLNNYSMELTSILNQSANKVDSRAYGENLKGTIARLGNIDKFITFIAKNPDKLPEVGSFVILENENYYISTLSIENQVDYTKYTIGLSKDFNALSKYIGIKNNIRLYEISEKQSVERYVIYEDYCVIGKPIESDDKYLLTFYGKMGFLKQFVGSEKMDINFDTADLITVARVKGKDINGNDLTEVDLSVIGLAMGNSLWFGFKYLDNFSAGKQSIDGLSQDVTDSNKFYRLNQDVGYTDYFGEIETLSIKMLTMLNKVENKTDAINSGNSLPESYLTLQPINDDKIMLNSNSDDIVIKKDSREQINFSYQLHFVTNNNIIIGSALAQSNPLIGKAEFGARLFILPNRINKFAKEIDLTNATLLFDYSQNNEVVNKVYYNMLTDNQIVFTNQSSNSDGKSWVIVDKNNNLLFGKNIDIKSGDVLQMPTITFTHRYI